MFNEQQCRRFDQQPDNASEQVFYIGTQSQIGTMLKDGIEALHEPIAMYSDPGVAAFCHTLKNTDSNRESFEMIVCKLRIEKMDTIEINPPESWTDIQKHLSDGVPTELKFLHTTNPAKQYSIYVLWNRYASNVVPQYDVLTVTGLLAQKEERIEELFLEMRLPSFSPSEALRENSDKNAGTSQVLIDFQRKADEEIEMYQQRLQRDTDPDVAVKIQQYEDEAQNVKEAIDSLRIRIDGEKAQQEQLLRSSKHNSRSIRRK